MTFPKLITRKRLKWTGLAAIFCLAATMVASYWYWPRAVWSRENSGAALRVGVNPGAFFVERSEWDARVGDGFFHVWWLYTRHDTRNFLYSTGFAHLYEPTQYAWLPTIGSSESTPNSGQRASIPFWIPVVLVALPTMILFYRDRKPKPGCCATCRYDLTGLSSETCPECGTKIATTDSNKATASAAEGASDATGGENGVGLEGNGVS